MTSVQITNPSLPFWDSIPGGLSVGKVIQIQGVFPALFDVSKYSKIELCQYSPDTIPLHISIRFNHRKVIRNTFQRNNWQAEEDNGPFPFREGNQFLIQIVVQSYGYQISVNGQHCYVYNHRLPYSAVTHLNIDGPLTVWSVEYKSNTQIPGAVFQPISPIPGNLVHNPFQGGLSVPLPVVPVRLANKPRLPYCGNLPQRLAVGSTVEIKCSFPISIDKSQYTEINLFQNSESTIALHLSIRFNHSEVVLNTFRMGKWETEEKGGSFPFALGREYLIQIVVQLFAFQISINGIYCWSFSHKLPFGMVNGLRIKGPANIQYVDYKNIMEQQQMPQQPAYNPALEAPQAGPSLGSVHNPAVPFTYHINGGIKAGMMIFLSAIPSANFHKFTISLQCGQQQQCPDIAFQFEVRGYNGTVVRNTRRNGRWEDEETAAPYFPFHSSCPFDLMILVQNDKYKIAVSGTPFIEFYHRMTRFGRINILKIENDVRITSVRFSE